MADEEQGREALAMAMWHDRYPYRWQRQLPGVVEGQSQYFRAADAILASDWLKAHDAEVAAKAFDRAVAYVCEMGGLKNIGWHNPYRTDNLRGE